MDKEREKIVDLLLDAHYALLSARKHLNESLHEVYEGSGLRHDDTSRRQYGEMAEADLETAAVALQEALFLDVPKESK